MSGEFPDPINEIKPIKLVAKAEKLTQSPTDIVVVRPPLHLSSTELEEFEKSFTNRHFLPVFLEQTPGDDVDRYYPTDMYREVGSYIFGDKERINRVLEACGIAITTEQRESINRKYVNEGAGNGGAFVYTTDGKVLVYEDHIAIEEMAESLVPNGWKLYPTNIEGLRLQDNFITDLDFLLFPFVAIDGKLHALVAEEYRDRSPNIFIPHIIPGEEVVNGACNIGDVGNGKTLILPNRLDAPTTHTVLRSLSRADIIETPPGFLEGQGGPRCSISSITISP